MWSNLYRQPSICVNCKSFPSLFLFHVFPKIVHIFNISTSCPICWCNSCRICNYSPTLFCGNCKSFSLNLLFYGFAKIVHILIFVCNCEGCHMSSFFFNSLVYIFAEATFLFTHNFISCHVLMGLLLNVASQLLFAHVCN